MDVEKIRADFPVLERGIAYLDSACMTLRPKQVIEEMCRYYYEFPACPGRSLHRMGAEASEEMEKSRKKVAGFLGAGKESEIVFTRNTTEAINLVARSLEFGERNAVVTSDREHNSNLVPWQLAGKRGVEHRIVRSTPQNEFDLDAFREEMDKSVRLVSVAHASNLDGYVLPAREIIRTAHDFGALVLLDGAQSAPHSELSVKKMDCDFFTVSAHKMLGPSGMGCLYAKESVLEEMEPFIAGGSTVANSTYESAEFLKAPEKFEAGLQDIAGIMGFGKACDYLERAGRKKIGEYGKKLNERLQRGLEEMQKVEIVGVRDAGKRTGITSFNVKGLDSHDVAVLLDEAKIAVRSGMHCLHSWFNARKIRGSVRASFYLYNTREETELLLSEVRQIEKQLA